MGLTMGMGAALLLSIWVVMLVAMMFPTAAPMILMFARVHADKRQSGKAFVPTWVFVSAYLLLWTRVAVMAVVTLLIFAEKSLPMGQRIAQLAALALISS